MRWGEHWRISRDCFEPKKSLAYQFGSILPDWFNRHPIHTWRETRDIFLDRAYRVMTMKSGLIKEWNLGILAHYICDYCCMAHNEQYHELYKHRVYEVLSQRLYKKNRRIINDNKEKWMAYDTKHAHNKPTTLLLEKAFKSTISQMIEDYIADLHLQIGELDNNTWYKESRIMQLDIKYAYALLKHFIRYIA